ncbi:MAG: squalene--hopene cyclase [Miltoncostaeaceae bacterium]
MTRPEAPALRDALERGADFLAGMQHSQGYWWEELEANSTITAEHLFLMSALGLADDDLRRRVANELLATQREDGSWAVWFEGPADLNVTAEAYYALKLAGVSPDAPEMRRAREVVLWLGGAGKARFLTRVWLALLGEFPWSALPVLPPEMIFLPPRAPLSPYRFACWARGTFVALMIVLSRRPTFPQPESARELFAHEPGSETPPSPRTPGAWSGWLARGERLARAYNRAPIGPLRRRAEARVARWICDRQEADGSWGGIQPPWVFSLLALHSMGFPLDHPVMRRGLDGFDDTFSLRLDDGERLRIQPCLSPVWDTALAAVALLDAGRAGTPEVDAALGWMRDKEVDRYGDWWEIPRRGRPGGWSFEFENVWYPDTDDTAEVLIALRKAGAAGDDPAVRRGVEWLRAMQSADGGWGAFDVDNTMAIMNQLPMCDFGEVLDPPTEDVTAHVVEALAECGVPADDEAVRRGVTYLARTQRPDGSWWGRWGVNHVYGTGAVLPALAAAGVDMGAPMAQGGLAFLVDHQNVDGGWGEDIRSYTDEEWIGRGTSTPSQTAWALLGIHAVDPGHPAADRGLRYLMDAQRADGSWDEPQFTGTGFPSDFMIKYHGYRQYFPVTALARFSA